jgi:hypothetical protein
MNGSQPMFESGFLYAKWRKRTACFQVTSFVMLKEQNKACFFIHILLRAGSFTRCANLSIYVHVIAVITS